MSNKPYLLKVLPSSITVHAMFTGALMGAVGWDLEVILPSALATVIVIIFLTITNMVIHWLSSR